MNKAMDLDGQILSGTAAVAGAAVGEVCLYQRLQPVISEKKLSNDKEIKSQLEKLNKTLALAEQELKALIATQPGKHVKELLEAQIEMIRDPDLRKKVEQKIKTDHYPVDAALSIVFEEYLELVEERNQDSTDQRSVDIADVRDRLIQILHDGYNPPVNGGSVLVADELSPREVIELSRQQIQGIIMEQGGTTSHAVILARALQIPTVVGVEKACSIISSGETVVLDGEDGKIIIDPARQTKANYKSSAISLQKKQRRQNKLKNKPCKTTDGHPFLLRANMGLVEELTAVQQSCAEGIGLLRTESAYLNRSSLGSEQNQRAFYDIVLNKLEPHPVTIRLFDAGGDKFFDLGQREENPYLGWRGIRMLLDEKELLEQQLRAILTVAGAHPGRVNILVPMISSIEEVRAVKKMVKKVQDELKRSQKAIDPNVPLGIMVEVPVVALQAETFARHVDFLSIGTNDLTQYLLAVDRGNERMSGLYNQRHPVVWSMIQQITKAGTATQTPVSVCGELASDPVAACGLLGLGITELSMASSALGPVKEALCNHTLEEMQQLAESILKSTTATEVDEIFANF